MTSVQPLSGGESLGAGDESVQVEELQRMLGHLDIFLGYPDGRFGDETETAVREFQVRFGLEESGRVDETQWELLTREARDAGYGEYQDSGYAEPGSESTEHESSEQRADGGPAVGELSPDGAWSWNGTEWVTAEQPQDQAVHPGEADGQPLLSDDGQWRWNGTEWVPNENAQPHDTGGATSPAQPSGEAAHDGEELTIARFEEVIGGSISVESTQSA